MLNPLLVPSPAPSQGNLRLLYINFSWSCMVEHANGDAAIRRTVRARGDGSVQWRAPDLEGGFMTSTGPGVSAPALVEQLREKARLLRIHSLRMTTAAGSGHPTSCLSAAELVTASFFHAMKFD